MLSNLTHIVRSNLRTVTIVLCLVTTAFTSQGQSRVKSSEVPVIQGAPHLPAMIHATGKDVMHGGTATYALKENEASITAWVKKYPQEFKAYQVAIQKYLQAVQPETMRPADKAKHDDLKAQWMMIQQMNLTWDTLEINNSN